MEPPKIGSRWTMPGSGIVIEVLEPFDGQPEDEVHVAYVAVVPTHDERRTLALKGFADLIEIKENN